MTTTTTPYRPELLPAPVTRYLEGRLEDGDPAGLVAAFAADARVVDEATEYRGADEIRRWLTTAGSEYTYTATYQGQVADGPGRWTVLSRIEGNFPGGVADLRLRFRVGPDGIEELVIAP
ncbi:nuclear transport factor 2 family protein [Georgenia phoenicis]|uniref:nuclear transport factor 2 family protein n=1 Tax=unclassified Georgenia TaxID=2626815 RepID=UPI0039B10CCD